MPSERHPCIGGPGTRGMVRGWSEDPLTARARSVWSWGDLRPIARSFAPGAEAFVGRLAVRRGESVLDVGCGTGNLAIAAARAGASVSAVDLAPNVVALAQGEARAAACTVGFEVGDAEALPYADRRFDTTASMFGAMFAYRPERAARELARVTRRGGRVAMANWTPGGLLGGLLQAHTDLLPAPPGVPSPLEWGRAEVVRERLGGLVAALSCTRRTLKLHFPLPPAAVTELFATSFGPTIATTQAVGPGGACRLREELTRLFTEHNVATDDTTVVAGEYLDVQARIA